jgi:hypothetical protein
MGSGSRRSFELARQRRTLRAGVNALYRRFKAAGDSADGASGIGLNGSLRAGGLVDILLRMRVKDMHVLDLGAGDGRVLLAALLAGAGKASGYELVRHSPHKSDIVFHRYTRRIQTCRRLSWTAQGTLRSRRTGPCSACWW